MIHTCFKQNARPASKGRDDRGTTFVGRAGALLDPLCANNPLAIGCPDNVGRDGSDYKHLGCLHLSSSGGNFGWVWQDAGLSLARTALSTAASLLSSVSAVGFCCAYIITKSVGGVKD
jgi:hypothetical protein